MGRRGRDVALFFLRFLVFPLVIYGTGDHGISSLIANPLSTQARTRALIYKTLGKTSSGSSLTFLHAAGPHSLPGPQPSILTPSIVTSPGADFVKELSPVIWPLPPEPNHKHGSSTLYSHSPEESARTYPAVAPATRVPVHKEGQRGNLAPTPFSLFTLSAPSALHRHVPFPKVKWSYALPPALSPTPLHSFKAPKKKIWHFALPPRGAEVNLAPPPKLTTKKSSNDPSPRAEGPMAKIAHSHPCVDIHKKPFFPPVQVPFTSPNVEESTTPASTPTCQKHNKWLTNYPSPSPSYFRRKSESPLPQPTSALPPPPPNLNCGSITCQEPLANPVLGPPCACVLPIKVGLNLGVALYTFFPLVSEFAQEIASAVFVKQNQVRIIGANATFEDPERTVVLIDLVPIGKYFDSAIAFLTYEKFWHKKVAIQVSYFGDYDVLYVLYPGLPPAPPATPANINVEGGAYGNDNNGRAIQPLGVDVRKKKSKMKPNGSLIAIIVLSSVISIVVILGVAWFLLLVHREHSDLPSASSQSILPFTKLSAAHAVLTTAGSRPSSASLSSSNIPAYNGSAKKFSLYEIERITSKFDESRVIGEGGFGRVYQGTVEDGTRVAVKVLKRDDQQGEREFFAEVEMLSRLHHRNLVKLIGICSEENMRCLIYELVPNGSVDSHLHGVDKKIAPLDWQARMNIALGTARALAYLHEDSSPRVIHRDFKSSNILLEYDFTPKVSDFGLARTALDEGNEHISTRVMGTFGYVAPEYAMTGHLLVKSDVYSYGVVLLELLTGRKPIDMSQPPGQENLVSWARPLLSKAERIVDPSLGNCYPHDSIAKVMAIASMCVEPEVSHRPFMGEVVQALKLVCSKGEGCSHSEIWDNDGSPSVKEAAIARVGTPQSGMLYASERNIGNEDSLGLFRTHSSSDPLGTGRSRHFWQS